MFNAIPDLEELRLSDGTSQGSREGIKEEETFVPKLLHVFIWMLEGALVPV